MVSLWLATNIARANTGRKYWKIIKVTSKYPAERKFWWAWDDLELAQLATMRSLVHVVARIVVSDTNLCLTQGNGDGSLCGPCVAGACRLFSVSPEGHGLLCWLRALLLACQLRREMSICSRRRKKDADGVGQRVGHHRLGIVRLRLQQNSWVLSKCVMTTGLTIYVFAETVHARTVYFPGVNSFCKNKYKFDSFGVRLNAP